MYYNDHRKIKINSRNSRATKSTLKYIGNLIRLTRKERGVTQQELCERMGVSRGLVKRIEFGNPNVSIGAVFEACFILGIPLLGCDIDEVNNLSKMLSYMNRIIPLSTPNKNLNFNDDF